MTLHDEHQAAKHAALAEALPHLGRRLSTIGARVTPPAQRRPLGRPMRDGTFQKRLLARLPPAPRPGHWSEAME